MDDRKPWFGECGKCGERWKLATLPMDCGAVGRMAKVATCPNCGERKNLGMCPTDGPHAVTEPRQGKESEHVR